MIITFVLILIFLFLLFFTVFLLLRLYLCLDWKIDQQESYMMINCFWLRMSIYEVKMDLEDIEQYFTNDPSFSLKSFYSSLQNIRHLMRFEHLTFDVLIGTDNPIHTAYLYPLLQSLTTSAEEHRKVSVNFQEKIFQSNGQCMISVKMCHTIKVIKILKQLQRKGD